MIWLWVALPLCAGWILLARRRAGSGLDDRIETLAILALLGAPLLLALVTLWTRDHGEHLAFDYEAKRIDLARQPATLGGGAGADLPHPDVRGRIEVAAIDDRLRFTPSRSPLPVLRIDGAYPQAVALEDGDWLVLRKPRRDAVCVRFVDRRWSDLLEVHRGEACASIERGQFPTGAPTWRRGLPTRLRGWFRGAPPVVLLRDTICDGSDCFDRRMLSALFRPRGASSWHLLVRDLWPSADDQRFGIAWVRPRADGAPLVDYPGEASWEAAAPLELRSMVIRGPAGRRRLETVRRDRLELDGERLLVQFARPQRTILPSLGRGKDDSRADFLILPGRSALTDRPLDASLQTVSLGDESERFRHLSVIAKIPDDEAGVLLSVRDTGEAGLRTTAAQPVLLGEDEGPVLRIHRFNRARLALIPALIVSLFGWCFLLPAARFSLGFAALLVGSGCLIALRGAFAYRVALEGLTTGADALIDAVLAALLIPSAIYAGWLIGIGSRQGRPEVPELLRAVLPLGLAALLSLLVGGVTPLAGLPVLAGAAACAWMARPSGHERFAGWVRWRRRVEGGFAGRLPAPVVWSVVIATTLALLRLGAVAIGMPERLRFAGLRLAWSVIHIPICVLLMAWLIAYLLGELDALEHGRGRWRHVAAGMAALAWIGLVDFVIIGLITADFGLVLVHGFSLALATLLLARPLLRLQARSRNEAGARPALALGLLVIPVVAVLALQVYPSFLIFAADLDSEASYRAYRVLALTDPERLAEVGIRESDAMGLLSRTMHAFAADGGWLGGGFLSGEVPRYLGRTYLNDLVPMTFVLPEFGKFGMLALTLFYLLLGAAAWQVDAPAPGFRGRFGQALVVTSVVSLVGASLYMMAANVGQTLLSGKNCYLLALDSRSDLLESALLLGLAACGLALRRAWR